MIRVLFLCTGNSCRSQMAEGFARARRSQELEAFSAGVRKAVLDPLAVRVMAEAGVDISAQRSKLVSELPHQDFDYVITLCDHAHGSCPAFPGITTVLHRPFDDPPALTRGLAEEDALAVYRRIRDELRTFVDTLPQSLPKAASGAPSGSGQPIPPPTFGF